MFDVTAEIMATQFFNSYNEVFSFVSPVWCFAIMIPIWILDTAIWNNYFFHLPASILSEILYRIKEIFNFVLNEFILDLITYY